MIRHLLSCLSMMASHSGTCVVMPGWNGPKSPCHVQQPATTQLAVSSAIAGYNTPHQCASYPDKVEHAAVLADLELRQDPDELLLRLPPH